MDSPLPAIVLLLIGGAVAYQVAFRYDHWIGGPNNTLTYERDNLTGLVRELKPGESVDGWDRFWGKGGTPAGGDLASKLQWHLPQGPKSDQNQLTPPSSNNTGQTVASASPTAQPTGNSTSPPVPPSPNTKVFLKPDPPAPTASSTYLKNFMEFSDDLNGDGGSEQIILQRIPGTPAGKQPLADISVVQGMHERFNAQGVRLHILPTKHLGWSDLALELPNGIRKPFRYNADMGSYVPQ